MDNEIKATVKKNGNGFVTLETEQGDIRMPNLLLPAEIKEKDEVYLFFTKTAFSQKINLLNSLLKGHDQQKN